MDQTTTFRGNSNPNKFATPRYTKLVPMFIQGLESPSSELQRNAAQALGRIGDRRAVEPLQAMLEAGREFAVRKAAAKALGKLGDSRALPVLAEALTKPCNAPFQQTISKAMERIRQQQ